jgi:outer membrane protein assembly factor BamB
LAVSVALFVLGSVPLPDVRAASGTSVDAAVTWGTASTAEGRAQNVRALAVAGRRVFLGGEFTAMVAPGAGADAAATVGRNYLAALDVDRHTLLPWNPDPDGPVRAMALSADRTQLYVGGDFQHIGGSPAPFLARLDLKTGKVDPRFQPQVSGRVRAIALAGDRLYVGGHFTSVGGAAGPEFRSKLAALEPGTGALLPWIPPVLGPGRYVGHLGVPTPAEESGDVLSIAVPTGGTHVYVGGTFTDFAGRGGLLVLDAATAQPLPQHWQPGRPVFSLVVSPADGQTVFGSAGGPGGEVFALRPATPETPLWASRVDGDAPGVAASATTVYLVGHFDYAGAESAERRHLAAFDAATGAVDDWNPVANSITGGFSAAVGAGHVFVGGEFTRINDRPQPGFAQFAVPERTATSTTTTTTAATSTTSTTTTTAATSATTATTATSTATTSTAPRRTGRRPSHYPRPRNR